MLLLWSCSSSSRNQHVLRAQCCCREMGGDEGRIKSKQFLTSCSRCVFHSRVAREVSKYYPGMEITLPLHLMLFAEALSAVEPQPAESLRSWRRLPATSGGARRAIGEEFSICTYRKPCGSVHWDAQDPAPACWAVALQSCEPQTRGCCWMGLRRHLARARQIKVKCSTQEGPTCGKTGGRNLQE